MLRNLYSNTFLGCMNLINAGIFVHLIHPISAHSSDSRMFIICIIESTDTRWKASFKEMWCVGDVPFYARTDHLINEGKEEYVCLMRTIATFTSITYFCPELQAGTLFLLCLSNFIFCFCLGIIAPRSFIHIHKFLSQNAFKDLLHVISLLRLDASKVFICNLLRFFLCLLTIKIAGIEANFVSFPPYCELCCGSAGDESWESRWLRVATIQKRILDKVKLNYIFFCCRFPRTII